MKITDSLMGRDLAQTLPNTFSLVLSNIVLTLALLIWLLTWHSPSAVELQSSREWLLSHSNDIVCSESGMALQFFSQEGCTDGWNMFSADQGDTGKAADEEGQVWICGSIFWNRFMNVMNPLERIDYLKKLVSLYDPLMADAVIHCYLEELSDEEADAYLLRYGIKRNFNVKKSNTIWNSQKFHSIKRKGESNRDWTEEEMKNAWFKLCSICVTTGIRGGELDITWNRFTDDLRHNEQDCISNLVRLNDAVHSHKAFKSQESLRRYCEDNGIDIKLNPIRIFNQIVRPAVEQLIRVQSQKLNLPLPDCLQ